jgi:LysM repeat protein
VHKVVSGDTPSAIARRYGVTLKALQAANPGMRANQLRIGQTVNIPVK